MLDKRWKKVIFAVAIAILYIPMVYFGTNTFFPEEPRYDCYEAVPLERCGPEDTACMDLQVSQSKERQNCYEESQVERKIYEGNKYLVLMIICLVTSLVMLFKFDSSITYGLFFGIVITAFTGTLRYIDSRSIIGFFLMVALFIIVIYFVYRERKKR